MVIHLEEPDKGLSTANQKYYAFQKTYLRVNYHKSYRMPFRGRPRTFRRWVNFAMIMNETQYEYTEIECGYTCVLPRFYAYLFGILNQYECNNELIPYQTLIISRNTSEILMQNLIENQFIYTN